MTYQAGLDLGQRGDYTALVVVRRQELRHEVHEVVFARRWRRLGYLQVLERVAGILNHKDFEGRVHLRIDATGVGVAVPDLFKDARLNGLNVASLQPITFSAGLEANPHKDTVPKKDLVARAQILLAQGHLLFPRKLQLASAIREELKNYAAKMSATGRTQFEAAGSGHDDLVTALALAVYHESGPLILDQHDYLGPLGEVRVHDPFSAEAPNPNPFFYMPMEPD